MNLPKINKMDNKTEVVQTKDNLYKVVLHHKKGLKTVKVCTSFQDAKNYSLVYNRGGYTKN